MNSLVCFSLVYKIGVVIVHRIRILDASTEEYQEEEETNFQGEEDHFDQYHQGKLTLANHHDAKLYKSKAPSPFYFMFLPIPCFTSHLFLLIYFRSTF
jgi:hypothetical protein